MKTATYIEKPRLACSRCRLIRVSIGSERNRKGQRSRLFTENKGVKREGLLLSTCNSCDGGGRGRAATPLYYVTVLLSFPLSQCHKNLSFANQAQNISSSFIAHSETRSSTTQMLVNMFSNSLNEKTPRRLVLTNFI